MDEPQRSIRRGLAAALFIACLTIGAGYLAKTLFGVPLLPEDTGSLLIKILPLPVFEALLRTLGVAARPLLLVGATVGWIILITAAAALAIQRLEAYRAPAIAALVGGAALLAGLAAGDGVPALIEAAILAGTAAVANMWTGPLLTSTGQSDDRRRLVRSLLLGAAGLAVAGIAFVDVRRFVTALATKEGTRAMTELTPVADFYVVSKNLVGDPVIAAGQWRLTFPDGRSIDYAELLGLTAADVEATLECISNDIGGMLISNGRWRGPRVLDLLAVHGGEQSGAHWLLMDSADGYTESLPLAELTPDHILATHLNGQPLTSAHGFPARFIFPGHYGMKQPKWVTRIRLSATDQRGYWEQNGWNEQAVVKTMSRVDAPQNGDIVAAGSIQFRGIAFAGNRRVSRVQLRFNGGPWQDADLDPEFSAYAWRFWELTTSLSAAHYDVEVRAGDGGGTWQTAQQAPTLPDGASGYHRISVDVR